MSKVGLEIEVESRDLSLRSAMELMRESRWVVEGDGSLRGSGAFELKYREGYDLAFTRSILRELYPALSGSTGSWRAAVHCHTDMVDTTRVQRGVLLGLAMVFDKALFERHSPERVESNFSVPLMHKSASVVEAMSGLLHAKEYTHYGKYSSVNIRTLSDLGTVEFRHMRTPECDGSVASVTAALELIYRFARDCAYLRDRAIEISRYLHSRSRRMQVMPVDYDRLINAFSKQVTFIQTDMMGMVPDGEALSLVIDAIDDRSSPYDVTCLDKCSVYGATRNPSVRRTRVGGVRVDSVLDEMQESWADAVFGGGDQVEPF